MNTSHIKSVEYRPYELNSDFPVLALQGDSWRLSDVRSPRLHFHNCLEIGFCREGNARMILGDEEVTIQEGDITCVGSEVVHTTWSEPGTRSLWSYIFVDLGQLLQRAGGLPELQGQDIFYNMQHLYSAVFPGGEHPGIRDLINTILHECVWNCDNFEYAVRGYFLAFTVHVMNFYRRQFFIGSPLVHTHQDTAPLMPALDYMRRHSAEDFSVDSLSALCHMSPASFRRTFSSVMGTSPLSYLIQLRIHNAVSLLGTTDMSILDISEAVGFHSISSFNRNFCAVMQKKPSECRKTPGPAAVKKQVKTLAGWMEPESPRGVPDAPSQPQQKRS
jgi:AraC family transcriptional activator of mtrCDE